jgi:hypothetical protein
MTPDELRTMYSGLWAAGVKAIGCNFTAYWLHRIVCEDYSAIEDSVPTLADCGRAFMNWKSSTQAQASGASVIKQGLERLAAHYGIGKKK